VCESKSVRDVTATWEKVDPSKAIGGRSMDADWKLWRFLEEIIESPDFCRSIATKVPKDKNAGGGLISPSTDESKSRPATLVSQHRESVGILEAWKGGCEDDITTRIDEGNGDRRLVGAAARLETNVSDPGDDEGIGSGNRLLGHLRRCGFLRWLFIVAGCEDEEE